jgi:hypothetical protein
VLTGTRGPPEDPFEALDVCHIFPAAKQELWDEKGYESWITDTTDPRLIGPSKLFSAQNGLLLRSDMHTRFDLFRWSINPDVSNTFSHIRLSGADKIVKAGYMVVVFTVDVQEIGGTIISDSTRVDVTANSRVSDDALRWHYHQAILSHLKGAGQKSWDLDYAGGDDMGMIMEEEDANEMMELEFANRLTAYVEEVSAIS